MKILWKFSEIVVVVVVVGFRTLVLEFMFECRRVDVIIICMDCKFTKLSRTTVFADPVERAQNSTAKCRNGFERPDPHLHLIRTWKVRVGDMVEIISGKDKGTQGEILQTDYRRNMVKVRGANLRRMKDKDGNDYQIEKKIHYSNVNLLDPVFKKPTRVDLRWTEDGQLCKDE
ncbi:60S ribosomal protein L24, putative [Perkinsus marinus ATCC 50983]|uniref:Large ribosomal subunit protein uL24c n=1 Tax=Perkinsus marinus (strain ATCC 50983 / TXsc) TaxID=423536 RepID=C5LE50_PERM5|nr:60S ribosomal protein L24, putative [Perkinsus marinus ATCC 50983]EER04990.1 60S ribosomal protein L24, putative [Perkinsus marinus ATCC 50983]|eukprot:XP_002773174.1 60S ribosomal protein L24, putative [Perkinsus marinus ATCC 50983]